MFEPTRPQPITIAFTPSASVPPNLAPARPFVRMRHAGAASFERALREARRRAPSPSAFCSA